MFLLQWTMFLLQLALLLLQLSSKIVFPAAGLHPYVLAAVEHVLAIVGLRFHVLAGVGLHPLALVAELLREW